MNIHFIEPYDGGSHRAFREGWTTRSRHEVASLTLPPRFWKWRMRGSAPWFADRLNEDGRPADLLFVTDFVNVADLRGLLAPPLDRAPVLLYMHENQLTYPLSPDEKFDFHFGFTNILSALAADRVVFNSAFHRDLFLDALPDYLGRMPDATLPGARERIEARCDVMPVGLDRSPRPDGAAPYLGAPCDPDAGPGWPCTADVPTLVWNHRWEFDKRPEWLAAALTTLADEGVAFTVHLLGEPRQRESNFEALRDRLGERVLSFGHEPDRGAYDRVLESSDVVVSCAAQEYFGISVAEAVQAGCYAVLPRDQVYPSLYGSACRGRHLYDGPDGLTDLLRRVLAGECGHVCGLPPAADSWCWDLLAPRYDDLCEDLCEEVASRHAETP